MYNFPKYSNTLFMLPTRNILQTANLIKYNRVYRRQWHHLVLIKSTPKFENEYRSHHYQQWQTRKYCALPFLLADTIIGSSDLWVEFESSFVAVFPETVGEAVFLRDSLDLAREGLVLGLVGDSVLTFLDSSFPCSVLETGALDGLDVVIESKGLLVGVVGSAVEAFVVDWEDGVVAGIFGPIGLLIGCPVQVPLPNAIFIPLGQRHECPIGATANRQRWLQLPLLTSHGLVTENLKQSHCVTCHNKTV